ncbi:hypothetical protein BGZ46_007676 [Entomortierella lignicola]|nr:hypothetical protein BGZ46_007676 [Entomortierella lignicola]
MNISHIDLDTLEQSELSQQANSASSDPNAAPQSTLTDSSSGSGTISATESSTKFINVDFSTDKQSVESTDTATLITKKKKSIKKDVAQKTNAASKRNNNRGEKMTFELDDVMRKYTPEQFKTCQAYDVGGVNILNKKPLDSKTALDKIKRRRETHNRVERRRRDCINQLIDELTGLLPREENSQSKCHRVNILRAAVAHIQNLTRQNENLMHQIDALQTGKPMPPPAIITTLAPILDVEDEDFDDDDEVSYKSETSFASSYTLSGQTQTLPHSPRTSMSSIGSTSYSSMSSPVLYSPYTHQEGRGSEGTHHQMEWNNPSMAHIVDSNLPASIVNLSLDQQPSSYRAPQSEHEPLSPSSGIPMIVEPSDSASRNDGPNSKRQNRQTLPRLQLVPPPFHQHQHQHQHQYQHHQHHRSNSGGTGPISPSFYGQDSSTSPISAYSGYSSSTAPWSSPGPFSGSLSATSSGYGYGGGASPRSPSFSNYGPPSPYSPYGPSSAHAHMSRSPVLAPWGAEPSANSEHTPRDEEMSTQRQPWPPYSGRSE